MLITKTVDVKWNKNNMEHYINKGYEFTNSGDVFAVRTEDLTCGSHSVITVRCDICGEVKQMEYRAYLKRTKDDGRYCCKNCCGPKIRDALIQKYGGVGLQSKIIKEKAQKTNLEKYGCETPFENKEVYEKIRKTQEDRYGGIGMASDATRQKIEATNMKIRGVRNPSQSDEIKEKKAQTCFNNYGVRHIFQDHDRLCEIMRKTQQTFLKNGTTPKSKLEEELALQIERLFGKENCTPSYLFAPLTFDCLLELNNIKIDVEYDGWYWHKNTQDRDRRRNYAVINAGYKVLRVKAIKEMPTDNQIIDAVNCLLNTDSKYKEIILDI